jgi:hypothetical protein
VGKNSTGIHSKIDVIYTLQVFGILECLSVEIVNEENKLMSR